MDFQDLEAINVISAERQNEEITGIVKGAWSSEEDSTLVNYIAIHGEGRWNHLAQNSGLKRTGRSCRLRWKNYLCPNVRRGNFTLEEQLRIMELYCLYGTRWSKIAEFLPGRTDNEIKNYWRTRVQKQAKLLEYDANSAEFREFIRNVWLPILSERIHASKCNDNVDDNVVVMNNFVGTDSTTGREPIQTDDWANRSTSSVSSDIVEAHQFSAMDNPSESDCWAIASGRDFGHVNCLDSPFDGYGSQGLIDDLAWFNSEELSDGLLIDHYFMPCP